jgi:uncharacterized repeat protein (TIGR03803 family)
MKKVLYILYGICVLISGTQAQTYFGLTKGDNSKIVKYDAAANSFTEAYSSSIGSAWYNDLLLVGTKLYGLTAGGTDNYGTIFSFEPATPTNKELHVFNGTNGSYPHGTLMKASNSKLYGMTESGGTSDLGVLFSIDPATGIYTKLVDFDGTTKGGNPFGSLTQAKNGKLYGMTESGGAYNYGVLFSYDLTTGIYTKLVDLDGMNGRSPYGSLIQAKNGLLYGMTKFGGTDGFGTVFSFDPALGPNGYTKLVDFNWNNGAWPNGSLTEATDNMLYGLTESGGDNNYTDEIDHNGVLFSLDVSSPSNPKFNKVVLDVNAIGRFPLGSLTKGTDGKLYGMTESGGANGNGAFFSYNPSTSSFASKSFDVDAVTFAVTSPTEVDYGVLPVHIISFTAKSANQRVQLKWVAEEKDIERYEVERSADGIRFTSLGFVGAKNESGRVEYNFTDIHPLAGNNYYRLKVHEHIGTPHYSSVKAIIFHLPEFTAVLQPNPILNTGQLKVVTENPLAMHLKLVDQHGRIIKQWHKRTFEVGQHNIPIEVKHLVSGTYHLILESSKGKKVIRLVKAGK